MDNHNQEHYLDPTAYEAIKSISDEDERVCLLVKSIKAIVKLAGFRLINRIELQSKTGRTYR